MPKVSVIVPIYKVEKYINQCLDSLINQTLKDIEIILIDDGSPDNCGKICDEYAENDNKVKVIHKKNAGVSAARNDGIKKATSDWVMFVDSDDWCELNMCEIAYENAMKSNADIAIFNHYNNYEKIEKINETKLTELVLDKYEDIEKLQMTILHNRYIQTLDSNCKNYRDLGGPWGKIFKKELIINNNIEFDLSLKGVFDDVFFCLNTLEKSKKITYQNIPLYHYRKLDNTMTTKFKEENLEIYNIIAKKFDNFIIDNNKNEKFKEAYNARIVFNLWKLLGLYFFHKSNGKKLSSSFRELKEVINSSPYKESIKNANMEYFSIPQKVYLMLFRIKSPCLIWCFYKIKTIRQKVKSEA